MPRDTMQYNMQSIKSNWIKKQKHNRVFFPPHTFPTDLQQQQFM